MRSWQVFVDRYRRGEWRDRLLHDMIVEDARSMPQPAILDIGCGRGFDGDIPLQRSIANMTGRFIGIEPDPHVALGDYFSETHRCLFEDAPLQPGSVDIAYSIMVLEHLAEPTRFFDKLHDVLRDGGVFWGLTVDRRHWFCQASLLTERFGLKDLYLDALLGRRGDERYENYPVCYRCNSPRDVRRHARRFRSCAFLNLSRVGQCNDYFPRLLHPVANLLDRWAIRRGRPGTLLVIRAAK